MYQPTDQQIMDIIVLRWNCNTAPQISEVVGLPVCVIWRVFDRFDMPRRINPWPLWRLYKVVDLCTSWAQFRTEYNDAYQGSLRNGHHAVLKKRIEENQNDS